MSDDSLSAAGRLTVYYSPASLFEGLGHLAGHVFVSVTNYRTGETTNLDVWSERGKPWGDRLYINPDVSENRREGFSHISWDLEFMEVINAEIEMKNYNAIYREYALIGGSCVTAATDVLSAIFGPESRIDVNTPRDLWDSLQNEIQWLPNVGREVCEHHENYIYDETSDPDRPLFRSAGVITAVDPRDYFGEDYSDDWCELDFRNLATPGIFVSESGNIDTVPAEIIEIPGFGHFEFHASPSSEPAPDVGPDWDGR